MAATLPRYIAQYGLKKAPFRLSPDPQFFFPAPTHLAAEKILTHAIANGEGFMVLTGLAGLGKTLLLRRLLESLDEDKLPLLILSPAVEPLGLLRLLLTEMEVDFEQQADISQLLQMFQDRLFEFTQQGKDLLIIIDEAQNMPVDAMEQLRMLSNFETRSRKLLQILLVGQLELETLLADARLGQLAQRIIVHQRLHPFTLDETRRYIQFRLERAGRSDIVVARRGLRTLFRASGGIPRLINKIMDRTLLLASADRTRILKKQHIQNAIESMQLQPPQAVPSRRRGFWPLVVITLVAGILALLLLRYLFLFHGPDEAQTFLQSFRSRQHGTPTPSSRNVQGTEAGGRLKIHRITVKEKSSPVTSPEESDGGRR